MSITISRCIIDGELLVWDSIAGRFEDFGKLKTFGTLPLVFSSFPASGTYIILSKRNLKGTEPAARSAHNPM